MCNQVETQKEQSQRTSIQQNSIHFLPRKGGLRTIGFKIICSKSNSITFYKSLGMRNQVETQKERFQGTSIQQNSMHSVTGGGGGGGGGNNRFQNNISPNPILYKTDKKNSLWLKNVCS